MRVPFYLIAQDSSDIKTHVICSHPQNDGKFEVRVNPSWPCLAKDGAGNSMHWNLQLVFIDSQGREYEVNEIKWED